jgi:CO/xanthine dehydrogenase FAD-binding subunit
VHLLQPTSIADALAARAAHPDATVVAGGTGVLVELNAGARPSALLDLSRVPELAAWERHGDVVRIGAAVTYTRIIEELEGPLPGLAGASRTVASRQVRNRATLGGALALGDPSGDALAALVAAGAQVELAGPEGTRRVAAEEVVIGPGTADVRPGELLTALLVPVADGPTAYAKAGARNAMARAVCGVAVALHPARRQLAVAVVGAGPRAVRAHEAEALVAHEAAWDGPAVLPEDLLGRAGALVAAALAPVPDARGSAAYRRRAAAVLTGRALTRAWEASWT